MHAASHRSGGKIECVRACRREASVVTAAKRAATTKAGGPRETLVSVSMAVSDAVRTASLSVWARAIIFKPCAFCLESAACEGDTPGIMRALTHKPRLTPARAVLCSLECTRQVVAGRWRTCVPLRRGMRRSSTFVMRTRVRATRASNPSHIARACGCSAH